MKVFRIIFFLSIFGLVLFSCKKENKESEETNTTLPNFGNVALDEVFKQSDSQLKNRDSIVSVIDSYYENVWEKGDLWGGFLVAKGDEILYEV